MVHERHGVTEVRPLDARLLVLQVSRVTGLVVTVSQRVRPLVAVSATAVVVAVIVVSVVVVVVVVFAWHR